VADADSLVDRFRAMVTGKADDAQTKALGRLAVFAGIKDLPSRVKCAVLPWHTLHAALHQEAAATTEGDADPAAAR
jgi:nitrogen fixation NifU-like protein